MRFTLRARFFVQPPARLDIPTMSLAMGKVPADASAATDLNREAVVTSNDPRGAGPLRGAESLVVSAHPDHHPFQSGWVTVLGQRRW